MAEDPQPAAAAPANRSDLEVERPHLQQAPHSPVALPDQPDNGQFIEAAEDEGKHLIERTASGERPPSPYPGFPHPFFEVLPEPGGQIRPGG